MLQILGRSRIIVLSVLVALNLVAMYALYMYAAPERLNSDLDLTQARSRLEGKRSEIQTLKQEYTLLQNQLKSYKELEARGFFNNQGRVEAQESFEKIRTVSGVINAKYDISAGEIVNDPRAESAGYVILRSPIKVVLESLDDLDVYSFLKLIQERFPGKVDIVGMKIDKLKDVTAEDLKNISSGKPEPVIQTLIEFAWKTMASQQSLSPDTANASTSETPRNGGAVAPTGAPQ